MATRDWRAHLRPMVLPGALLAVCGVAAAVAGFVPLPAVRVIYFAAASLPIVGVTLLVALACAVRAVRERERPGRVAVDDLVYLAALAAIVVLLCLAVPARMRIQADEYLIGAVSLGIWNGGLPLLPTSGFIGPGGMVLPQDLMMDKRGLLLPLLMGVLHFARGFDLDHGYIVNAIATFGAMAGVYGLLRFWCLPATAFLGASLLAAHPALAWATRSIALEPLNLALLAASAAVAVLGLRRPTAARALLLAWLAPLLAQARYESAVFAFVSLPIALLILARSRHGRFADLLFGLVPFAFVPFAWQRAHGFAHGLESIGAQRAFGLDYLASHAPVLFDFYRTPSQSNPLGFAFLAITAAALVVAVARLRRGTFALPAWRTDGTPAALAYAAGVVAVTLVVLAYAWGDLRGVVVLRLGLPMMLLGCVAAAVLAAYVRRFLRLPAWSELVAAGAALVLAMPHAARDEAYGRMHAGPGLNAVHEWKEAMYPDCRFVFVNTASPYFLLYGDDGLTVGEVEGYWDGIAPKLAEHRVDAVLLVQIADTLGGALLDRNTVPSNLAAHTVLETPVNLWTSVRIAQLEHASRPVPLEPAPGCRLRAASATL